MLGLSNERDSGRRLEGVSVGTDVEDLLVGQTIEIGWCERLGSLDFDLDAVDEHALRA